MKLNKILLTSLVASPSLVLPLNLTSCSQTWGYLNPISIGSIDKTDQNNPFYEFRNLTFNDADGFNIVDCLQSNFIIDQAKSMPYAYSSPVTKWFQTKEEAGPDKDPQVLKPSEWQKLDDGWKTTSDNIVTSTTLKDPDHDNVNKTYTNNWNFNLISNINFTTSIASTLLTYLSYGLQYQASQFANEADLNTAWGYESTLTDGTTLNTYKGTKIEEEKEKCRDYYEYDFAASNSHGTGRTTAFLRPTSVNFNFKTFPYPSYLVESTDKMDVRQDISTLTKRLLMGSNANEGTKFCDAGQTTDLPAYYTDSKDITVTLPYLDNNEWKWYDKGVVKQYLYSAVPILVTAKNISSTWVDPLKNDSFVPSDFFIYDKEIVNNTIGSSWSMIEKYAGEDTGGTQSTRQSFQIDVNSTKICTVVGDQKDARVDWSTIPGNTYVVLVSYVVNEYNSKAALEKYEQDPDFAGGVPEQLQNTELAKLNAVSINNIDAIFPAYLLGLENYKGLSWFKEANNYKPETGDFYSGYIIDTNAIQQPNNDLLNLLKRSSTDGMKPHAHDLTQPSKDLLAFLAYMFGTQNKTQIDVDDFLTTTKWQPE